MRISAFLLRTGVSRDTVRFYERRGLLRPAVAANGYRNYTELDVERVEMIRMGQRLGFTLRELGPLARAWENDALGPDAQRRVIRQRLGEVDLRIAEMQAIRTYLAAKLRWLDQGAVGPRPVLGGLQAGVAADSPRSGATARKPASTLRRKAKSGARAPGRARAR